MYSGVFVCVRSERCVKWRRGWATAEGTSARSYCCPFVVDVLCCKRMPSLRNDMCVAVDGRQATYRRLIDPWKLEGGKKYYPAGDTQKKGPDCWRKVFLLDRGIGFDEGGALSLLTRREEVGRREKIMKDAGGGDTFPTLRISATMRNPRPFPVLPFRPPQQLSGRSSLTTIFAMDHSRRSLAAFPGRPGGKSSPRSFKTLACVRRIGANFSRLLRSLHPIRSSSFPLHPPP